MTPPPEKRCIAAVERREEGLGLKYKTFRQCRYRRKYGALCTQHHRIMQRNEGKIMLMPTGSRASSRPPT